VRCQEQPYASEHQSRYSAKRAIHGCYTLAAFDQRRIFRSLEEGAIMKTVKSGFQCCLLFIPTLLVAQASTESVEIEPLKSQLAAQQKLFDGLIA
jgi:hypothetical protein